MVSWCRSIDIVFGFYEWMVCLLSRQRGRSETCKLANLQGACALHVCVRTYYIQTYIRADVFLYFPLSSVLTMAPALTILFNQESAVLNGTDMSSAASAHWLLLNSFCIMSNRRSRSETFLFFTSLRSIKDNWADTHGIIRFEQFIYRLWSMIVVQEEG